MKKKEPEFMPAKTTICKHCYFEENRKRKESPCDKCWHAVDSEQASYFLPKEEKGK